MTSSCRPACAAGRRRQSGLSVCICVHLWFLSYHRTNNRTASQPERQRSHSAALRRPDWGTTDEFRCTQMAAVRAGGRRAAGSVPPQQSINRDCSPCLIHADALACRNQSPDRAADITPASRCRVHRSVTINAASTPAHRRRRNDHSVVVSRSRITSNSRRRSFVVFG
jgi:hypothetical protein